MDNIFELVRCPYCNKIIESCFSGTTYKYKDKHAWIHWHSGCGDFIAYDKRQWKSGVERRYHMPDDFKTLILPIVKNILFTNKDNILDLQEDQIKDTVYEGVKQERNLNADFVEINKYNIRLMTEAYLGYLNPPALTSEPLTPEIKSEMKIVDVELF